MKADSVEVNAGILYKARCFHLWTNNLHAVLLFLKLENSVCLWWWGIPKASYIQSVEILQAIHRGEK